MPEDTKHSQLGSIRDAVAKKFGGKDGVLGVDIGLGKNRLDLAVRLFHVLDELPSLPDMVEAWKIHSVELGQRTRTPPKSDRSELIRIQPGIGISRTNGGPGTLGLIAYDPDPKANGRSDLEPYAPVLVSCWHILLFPGATPFYKHRGTRVVAPAAFDTVDSGDIDYHWIASVSSTGRRMPLPRHHDAAFAHIETDILAQRGLELASEQLTTGVKIVQSRKVTLTDVENRTVVTKVGRSTRKTHGVVDGIGTYYVEYGRLGRVEIQGFRIVPCPAGEDISNAGDSGAAWYLEDADPGQSDKGRTGVGLHFEGNPLGAEEYALASHLPCALKYLGLDLTKG